MHEEYKQREDWKFSAEPNFRLLLVKGDDAQTFLQGQLTQDVVKLPAGKAAWCASCNYQGRVAAVSLIFKLQNGGFGLLLPADNADAEMERLQKYVLRSKVEMQIAPLDITYFTASEATAADTKCPGLPKEDMQVQEGNSVITVRLPRKGADGFYARYVSFGKLPIGMPKDTEKNKLMSSLMALGVPFIGRDESLEWLPQALNLDLVGAVAKNKGCYTGQEVINKTQSLGRVKRRMLLGKADITNVDDDREVFAQGQHEPIGRIVLDDGEKFFYVISWDYFESPMTVQGKPIQRLELPYMVTIPESAI